MIDYAKITGLTSDQLVEVVGKALKRKEYEIALAKLAATICNNPNQDMVTFLKDAMPEVEMWH